MAASARGTELFHDSVEDRVDGAGVGVGGMTEGAGEAVARGVEAEGGGEEGRRGRAEEGAGGYCSNGHDERKFQRSMGGVVRMVLFCLLWVSGADSSKLGFIS